RDAFFDDASVSFDLSLARAAKKPKSAALTLKMGPGPHQPALLISQMCEFDLQRPLARACAPSKDLKDQTCAVDDFRIPRLLQITLLNRRDGAIHDHDGRRQAFCQSGNLVDLAFADVGRGPNLAEGYEPHLDHIQVDGAGETDGFVKARFWRPHVDSGTRPAFTGWNLEPRLDDDRPASLDARGGRTEKIGTLITAAYFQSDFISGRWLVGPLEELDRVTRHDGRDRVLVNELGMPIPPQQHTEVVEPGHNALQFDTVHQENGERYFAFADMIEKSILQILRTIGCHCRSSIFARV